MNAEIESLLQKRNLILEQMQAIDHLRRGSLSRQFFKSTGAAPAAAPGPYYLLQGYLHGQKFSQRVPASQAPQVQEHVENYRRFQALAEEFVTVCDQLTRLEGQPHSLKKTPATRGLRSALSRNRSLLEAGSSKPGQRRGAQ